jgi:carbamoyltransferase
VIILGLNAFHGDASAALVRDGVLIAAAEEERFRRVKHWAGFPEHSIAYCLREAKVSLADVAHVAVNQDNRANFGRKVRYLLSNVPDPRLLLERFRNRRDRVHIPELLAQAYPGNRFDGTYHKVEHHLAHLSSAFHVSLFDEAVVASVDGFGDFASAAWGVGRSHNINIEGRVFFPHSLGIFYQAVTQHLGFPDYGDEYKVMGLAAYGAPSCLREMRKIVNLQADGTYALDLTYFRHHRRGIVYQWDSGTPQFTDLFSPALEDLLGPRRRASGPLEQRHRDIACSAQAMYEEALFHLIATLQQRSGLTDIALAGGCAMNSVANGKLRGRTSVRRVYVPPAAGDAGGAVGAAFATWHRQGGKQRFAMDHAYWGPQFGRDEIATLLAAKRSHIAARGCTIDELPDENELCRRTAAAIAGGNVVGWFQGRMEWGPRALGNRSILCDPRCADVRALLNTKIKRREPFRPFAPSVLEGAVGDWFEEDVAVPFMSEVLQVRPEKRALIPAVTHVDGSGRLQTVSRQANPLYFRLIEFFRDLTGIPMVLNTSFNENEPIVCTPDEALDCFLRNEMDVLILGTTVITRHKSGKAPDHSREGRAGVE